MAREAAEWPLPPRGASALDVPAQKKTPNPGGLGVKTALLARCAGREAGAGKQTFG